MKPRPLPASRLSVGFVGLVGGGRSCLPRTIHLLESFDTRTRVLQQTCASFDYSAPMSSAVQGVHSRQQVVGYTKIPTRIGGYMQNGVPYTVFLHHGIYIYSTRASLGVGTSRTHATYRPPTEPSNLAAPLHPPNKLRSLCTQQTQTVDMYVHGSIDQPKHSIKPFFAVSDVAELATPRPTVFAGGPPEETVTAVYAALHVEVELPPPSS